MNIKEKILGYEVASSTYRDFIKEINQVIEHDQHKVIYALNPEKVMKAEKEPHLKEILQRADYLIPDGQGIIYAAKKFKKPLLKRLTGIEVFQYLLALAAIHHYRVVLYGAKDEVVKEAKKQLEYKLNGLTIVETVHGYETDQDKIIQTINDAEPHLLFVALGSPKQEQWIDKNRDLLKVNIIQGVGGSFDVISGQIKRAPQWIRALGLEWLYRLFKQPSRYKRYISLLRFILLVKRSVRHQSND